LFFCTNSWLQFIYGDPTNEYHKNLAKTCGPFHYHLHDLSQFNILLPPTLSKHFISPSNNQNNDPNDDSCNDCNDDNISNDTIQMQFNPGSNQNLVDLEKDQPFRSIAETNETQNEDTRAQKSFISRVRNNFSTIFSVDFF
jgi:hypothetical protein